MVEGVGVQILGLEALGEAKMEKKIVKTIVRKIVVFVVLSKLTGGTNPEAGGGGGG